MTSTIMKIVMILSFFYVWISCLTMGTLTSNYLSRKVWFNDGNIFHIEQEQFWTVFQQHRNVNRHFHWVTNEISSLNRQINSIKEQISLVIHTREQRSTDPPLPDPPNNSSDNSPKLSSPTIRLKNHRNIFIVNLLANETLFDGYLKDLLDLYEFSLSTTIECVAVVIEKNATEKYLLIKLSDGSMDTYVMNRSKPLKETFDRSEQSILVWNIDQKEPEYYRRFVQESEPNEIMTTDQLMEIKNRPKLHDVHFFNMVGQLLPMKYHTDPSSLSCILEIFFSNIYTCDGRLVHPHELKLLSDDNDLFVFYAVMLDTATERQIFPLETNNHIRHGDQIFFLFHTHPQFQSLASSRCTNCPQTEQVYTLTNNQRETEQNTQNRVIESKDPVDNPSQNFFAIISQNYIVYAIVSSILVYILLGIYVSRKQHSSESSGRKHLISSRRGR